ncbi:hypothetical protein MTR67_026558 [Solanum verrucosum]|uniref:Uncharacterized protein n=1 Tax=Solanum verrucosum TaxID=315347 RepID=A0AAF0TZT5_SOLVR|nr:hypothetical protein MTR67_026558 [Solanum verrucosum]
MAQTYLSYTYQKFLGSSRFLHKSWPRLCVHSVW